MWRWACSWPAQRIGNEDGGRLQLPDLQTAVKGCKVVLCPVPARGQSRLAMHGGLPFSRTARCATRTRSRRLCKILVDFALAIAYFFIGYTIAYGALLCQRDGTQRQCCRSPQGLTLVKFFSVHVCGRGAGYRFRRIASVRASAACVATASSSACSSLLEGLWEQELRVQEQFSRPVR